jgi:allophanate hydrolase
VASGEWLEVAVVGAHLSGMPLHGELLSRGAELVAATCTWPTYRLHALAGGPPLRPGLVRVHEGGVAIEVEVYRVPLAEVGALLAQVPAPLALGTVVLASGARVFGYLCETAGLEGAVDISDYGGWRAYLAIGSARARSS